MMGFAVLNPSCRPGASLLRCEAWDPRLVLRQAVGDVPPRCPRADEDMQFRAHAGIVVEQAGRNAYRLQVRGLSRHGRTADAAKTAEAAGRRFETLDQVF